MHFNLDFGNNIPQKHLLKATDTGEYSVLVLSDISAVFDTVNHKILFNRLEQSAVVSVSILDWFSSCVINRSFSVGVADFPSVTASLICEVLQDLGS